MVKPKPPPGIPLPLQHPQLLQPPRLPPVHLLRRLVAVRVVDVRIELSAGLARVERFSDSGTVEGGCGVVGGGGGVEG